MGLFEVITYKTDRFYVIPNSKKEICLSIVSENTKNQIKCDFLTSKSITDSKTILLLFFLLQNVSAPIEKRLLLFKKLKEAKQLDPKVALTWIDFFINNPEKIHDCFNFYFDPRSISNPVPESLRELALLSIKGKTERGKGESVFPLVYSNGFLSKKNDVEFETIGENKKRLTVELKACSVKSPTARVSSGISWIHSAQWNEIYKKFPNCELVKKISTTNVNNENDILIECFGNFDVFSQKTKNEIISKVLEKNDFFVLFNCEKFCYQNITPDLIESFSTTNDNRFNLKFSV